MTCAKRDGNDRDFCAAIRVKRKLFKLRAFTVDLQAPQSLSLFFRALSLLPSSAHSRSFARLFSPALSSFLPVDSQPLPLQHLLSSSVRPLFIVSVSFQAFRTVYKVEALNWKPRLCRLYCGFFFSPFRFRPVCCLISLLFLLFRLHLCPFCPCSVGGPLLCTESRNSPLRREDRSPLQLTLGPDLLNVLFLNRISAIEFTIKKDSS